MYPFAGDKTIVWKAGGDVPHGGRQTGRAARIVPAPLLSARQGQAGRRYDRLRIARLHLRRRQMRVPSQDTGAWFNQPSWTAPDTVADLTSPLIAGPSRHDTSIASLHEAGASCLTHGKRAFAKHHRGIGALFASAAERRRPPVRARDRRMSWNGALMVEPVRPEGSPM
jgi:hypothetical protein